MSIIIEKGFNLCSSENNSLKVYTAVYDNFVELLVGAITLCCYQQACILPVALWFDKIGRST